jgi:hypothetical protein
MWYVRETRELHTMFSWGDLGERDHLDDIGLDRIIILKWIFKKWDGEVWTELILLWIEAAGACKCGNELPGSIKCG